LTVQAGVMGNVLSKKISKLNLSGLEFLSGIPGTIGGMIYMNAGAWNHHISDIIESITYLDEFGKICVMEKLCDKGFGYRKSPFMKRHVIILSCTIKLTNDDNAFNRYLEYLTKKIASQPLKSYNAGCTFKNPLNQSAWKLIRKYTNNLQFNNIEISDIHANFLINKSNATFNEMIEAINLIQENVYQNTNIFLELELTILR
jgi:UDP-N-acetylmuramate dehydrogenase